MRYYDETVGRFISEDPVRFKAGTNFYRYVENNPVLFNDPTGLYNPFQHWPLNGNIWPQFTKQDEVCTTGPFANTMNRRVDWGYASAFSCYCDWVANSSRVKAYYHYTIVESAKFKCEPCDKIVNKTRTRTEDIWKYEEGGPIMPTQTKRTWGKPFQTGEFADDPSSPGCK